MKLPKCKHTSCKVIAFTWPIPLKKNYQKEILTFLIYLISQKHFRITYFSQSKKKEKENVPTKLTGWK